MKNLFCYTFLLLLLNLTPKINHAQWVTKYDMVGPAGAIYDMDFFKSDTGIFVGFTYDMNQTNQYALIMRTTNAGNTWNTLTSVTISHSDGLYSVSCVSGNTAYAGGTSFLIKTNNAGLTWDSIIFKIDNSIPISGTSFGKMNFTSVSNGLAIFNPTYFGGELIRTTNSGVSWNTILTIPVVSFYSIDGKNIYAITSNGFESSPDSGVTWSTSAIPSDSTVSSGIRPSVYFQNANVGFITYGIHLIKTTDGGSTWAKITIDQNDSFDLTNIQFIDSLNGFITAELGRFFRSSDGGNTWKKIFIDNGIPSDRQLDLIKPYYFNKNKACALAVAGDIEDIMIDNNLQLTTGITEIQNSSFNLKIFPNPATNELHIQTNSTEKLNVQLFDLTGKQKTENILFTNSTTINLQELSLGIYFLRITDTNSGLISIQKMVVLR